MTHLVAGSLDEARRALARELTAGGSPVVMAGGTDLLVRGHHLLRDHPVVDVSRVAELTGVEVHGGGLRLGAAVTYGDCLADERIRRASPLLAEVARRFASPAIRAVATLGGNVVNASPAADGVVALWALEAEVEVAGPHQDESAPTPEPAPAVRPLASVVRGPGQVDLPPGGLVVALRVPVAEPGERAGFYKLVNRAWPEHPMAIAVASAAVRLRLDRDGRVERAWVALGAVAPTPVRAEAVEAALVGRRPDGAVVEAAARAATGLALPIDDVRATAGYRRSVAAAVVRQALDAALSGPPSAGGPA